MTVTRNIFYISDRTGLTAENIGEALFFQPLRQRGGVEKFGFAQCVVADADIAERYRAADARADGFGEGFFGGEPFGEVVNRFAHLRKLQQLFGAEDAFGKRHAKFFIEPHDAFEGNEVCADAVNHEILLGKADGAAGRLKMSVFKPYPTASCVRGT